MLANLFDEKRRKEMQSAISSGAQIEFRKSKPLPEGRVNLGADSQDFMSGLKQAPQDIFLVKKGNFGPGMHGGN